MLSAASVRPLLVVVTNIPTPYRLHEFRTLRCELENRGIDFEAIFLSSTEPERYWSFSSDQYGFSHQIAPGYSLSVKGKAFLFNPGVIWAQTRRPPTWLWLGGCWYLPTVVALSWLVSLRRKPWLLGWTISHALDRHTLSTPFLIRLRHFVLQRYHGWVVPGIRAASYVNQLVGRNASTITFPQTVDETSYRDCVAELRRDRDALRAKYALSRDERVCLWPARLSPEKGILPFLDAIRPSGGSLYTILVAGEGPQRSEIESWLANHPEIRVRLLGHQDEGHLLELYALSDVLLLPSLSEPYGFAAVEGLWAGLPLVLSDRAGAVPEVLEAGVNGWLVEPSDPAQIRHAFTEILSCDPATLREMGNHSLALAKARFESRVAVARFVDELLEHFPPRN